MTMYFPLSVHSRTVPGVLISYNSYFKGVSCPTVMWLIFIVGAHLKSTLFETPKNYIFEMTH